MLHYIIIRPLEIILETLFCCANKLIHDPGITLIIVSVILNIILLPLYARADRLSSLEQKKQKEMDIYRKKINESFKGDERLLIMQYYYKIVKHSPFSLLRTLLPLILQIPFFIAAYSFFSNLKILENAYLFGIHGLNRPDAVIAVNAALSINILPVIMTIINIVSGVIYTRSAGTWQKIQIWVLALVFLVLLYNSPAGLVIYWTINNLFSLGRNIVSAKTVKTITENENRIPLIEKKELGFFILIGLFITILMGFWIPSAVLASEPSVFELSFGNEHPMKVLMVTLYICLGFMLWGLILYFTSGTHFRHILTMAMLAFAVMGWVSCYLFEYEGGKMSPVLNYITEPKTVTVAEKGINLFIIAAFIVLFLALNKRFHSFTGTVIVFALVLLMFDTGRNVAYIFEEVNNTDDYSTSVLKQDRVIPLSRNGKNVIVIMLDRAISRYVPYMLSEDPELVEQFAGFTWYPDTASFGLFTNYAAPALYGGYDYAPARINERKDERLVDKQNEALKVMPQVFASAGFKVTAADSPLAGYKEVCDMSIYDGMKGVNAYNLCYYLRNGEYDEDAVQCINRNLFYYSLYTVAPKFFKDFIYDEGAYLNAEGQVKYINPYLANNEYVLDMLDDITRIEDDDTNTFFMMSSCVTHEPMVLKLPEYELGVSGTPVEDLPESIWLGGVECSFKGTFSQMYSVGHYHVSMLAFKTLGKWFDHMREEGVYDNTRIILVADHGWELFQFEDMIFNYEENRFDIESLNPLFMVKDFNSTELSTDYTFMTNADTPSLAMEGLIDDPVNPYTHRPIDMKPKEDGIEIILGRNTDVENSNNGNTFLPENCGWFELHDSIFDADNYTVFFR